MKSYYELILEKSKQVRGKIEDVKNDVYWKDDAITGIWGILSSIIILSGFLEDKEFALMFKKETEGEEKVDGFIKIIDIMINKPSEQWKRNNEKIKPVTIVYRLKDALEDLKNAILIVRDSKELNKEQIRRIERTNSPGAKAFNVYLNDAKGKTNDFFAIINGRKGIESHSSRREGLFIQYVTLNQRIDGLLYVITPIAGNKDLSKEGKKEIDTILANVIGIQENLKNKLEAFKVGDRINIKDYQKDLKEQTRLFNHAKDDFFDSFKEFMVVDGRNKKVKESLVSAEGYLIEIDAMIEASKEVRKMFKGVDRKSELYKSLEKFDISSEVATKKASDAVEIRKGLKEPEDSENSKDGSKEKASFNSRTIEIDDQLREIFNKDLDKGKIKAELDKLDKLLGITK